MSETPEKEGSRWAAGQAIHRDMFGEARARHRLEGDAPEDARLTDLLFEHAYGAVWSNDTLSRRERSLITVALLAGLGRTDELDSHIGAALANGCTMAELHEAVVHAGLYCGFPATISGHKALKAHGQTRD
ncbi:MAG: carboxymuconolactone decarboxylase family protein [Alphaproteobacteria bacterium]|nr:carboxymuconolactone decarboxylase family protein [Alphaproteobacteria bacterium]